MKIVFRKNLAVPGCRGFEGIGGQGVFCNVIRVIYVKEFCKAFHGPWYFLSD